MSTGYDAAVALVIGIGNQYRSDDAVGLHVARRVRELSPPGVKVLELDGEATDLIHAWENADMVVVVDAVAADGTPGSIVRFEVGVDPIPPVFDRHSTHLFGIGEAIALGQVLTRLPRRLVVYGILGEDFGWGEILSGAVDAAIDGLAHRVLEELGGMTNDDGRRLRTTVEA
ncbi:MAG: hydrogenase maturation protease [Thermomicrobiales bacterium]|nr:hydrogenase maturation protease [Thermomicrobiales bacterium]